MNMCTKKHCANFCIGEHTYRGVRIHKIDGELGTAGKKRTIGYQPDNGHTFHDQVGQVIPAGMTVGGKEHIYARLKREVHKNIDRRLDGKTIGE